MQKCISPQGYGLHEGKASNLAENYDQHFAPLVGKEIKILEMGVHKGASLLFWRDYFKNATIIGVDCKSIHIEDPTGMIHIYQGYQDNIALLDRIASEQAPDGFDIIIDECSHIGRLTRISFWHLFQNHLKPGGLYAIEDWMTGYINWWPDGRRYRPKSHILYSRKDALIGTLASKIAYGSRCLRLIRFPFQCFISSKISSHTHGMVGFIKELIDAYVMETISLWAYTFLHGSLHSPAIVIIRRFFLIVPATSSEIVSGDGNILII